MFDFWGLLVVALGNFLVRVLTSAGVVKLIVTVFVYAFIFYLVPVLITLIVPTAILGAVGTYLSTLAQSTYGSGVLYILGWFQAGALFQCAFVALAVRFIFRRI